MGAFLQAAYIILKQEKKPLSSASITSLAIKHNILQTKGLTPDLTMKSKLAIDILRNKESSKFVRTEAGHFALREWHLEEYVSSRHVRSLFDEEVVVFPAFHLQKFIDQIGVNERELNGRELLSRCKPMRRRVAEEDKTVIQLVSLFLVYHKNKYLTYKRAKRLPEARLHGYYSITFGGHLNPSDVGDFSPLFDPFDTSQTSTFMERELNEELRLKQRPLIKYRGLVYDDSMEVSRQHLGILFEVVLDSPEYQIGERGFLIDPKFETLDAILHRCQEFESWSRLIAEHEAKGHSHG